MKQCIVVFIGICLLALSVHADFLELECQTALKNNQLILLSVEKEGCPYCLKMRTEIFDVPTYSQQISKHYLHISIHQESSILPKAFHVKYFPTNLILSPRDLHIIDEFAGYMSPDNFIELLDEVYAQEFK